MARLTQQQVEQWIAQNGGAQGLQYSVEQKQIRNPDPGSPDQYATIEVEVWRNGKTGAELSVRRGSDGDFEQIENKGADPNKPSAATTTQAKPPETKDEGGRRYQWQPNPGGADAGGTWVDVGAAPLTAAERAAEDASKPAETRQPVMTHPGYTQVTTKKGNTQETYYLDPNGNRVNGLPEKPTTAALVGSPTGNTRQRNEGGQVIKESEYVLPNGTKEWRTQSAPSESNQPLPAGMPTFRPDPNKEGMGLIEYTQQLTALRSQGKLTDAQFKEFVGLAHQSATAEAGRLDTIRSAQQQAQTNAISQRNADLNASVNRLNSANTATNNAFETSQKMASNFTNASYGALSGPILPAVMAIQDQRAQAWGGLNNPAPITTTGYPMLDAMAQMGMTPPAAAAAPVIPAVQQLVNTAQPNQIGAGNIGSVVAPGQVAPAQVAAPVQAVPAVSAPAMAAPAPVVAPAPPMSQQSRDNWQQPGTGDPGTEVGQPTDPNLYSPPGGAGGNVQMAPQVLPGVLQAGILAEVAGSGKYPPDVLEEAARQLGWG